MKIYLAGIRELKRVNLLNKIDNGLESFYDIQRGVSSIEEDMKSEDISSGHNNQGTSKLQ